jgi:XRE family transcriptional regulator, stress-response regulator
MVIVIRRLLGCVLRRQRRHQGRTLREVSAAAGVSLGYLSEIERGQKEASSECLAAIGSALDVPLSVLLSELSDEVARAERLAQVGSVAALPMSERERAGSRSAEVTNVAA